MRYRVLLLALSYALCGPVRSAAQDGPALKAPPPEASQFDFLVGEWTVDVASKAPGRVVDTEMIGGSMSGSSRTDSRVYPMTPKSTRAAENMLASTGRRMDVSESFIWPEN